MENIFTNITKENQLECEEVYDLKGSLYNRTGEKGAELKDNDWINNKKHGSFVHTYPDGRTEKEEWLNDEKQKQVCIQT